MKRRIIFVALFIITAMLFTALSSSATSLYSDVSANHRGYDDIVWATDNGLMLGTSGNKFSPSGKMSRAMLVTVLWRYEGEESAQHSSFNDVARNSWYTRAVDWAYEKGIVYGTSDTAFSPNANITREQLITILYRYAQLIGEDVSTKNDLSGFADRSSVSAWAYDGLKWAVAQGLIKGSVQNDIIKLFPVFSTTRVEFAAVMHRFNTLIKCDGGAEHIIVTDEALAPTCTETGMSEGKHCEVCGKVYIAQAEIAPLGHSVTEVTLEASCTEDGQLSKVCSVCSEIFETEIIPAKGHTASSWMINIPGQCTENGEKQIFCKYCDVITYEPIPPVGHSYALKSTNASRDTATHLCTRCSDEMVVSPMGASIGLEYSSTGNTLKLISRGDCRDEHINIPSTVNGNKVTAIADKAFADDTDIREITIPSTVTNIGTKIFTGCSNLNTVYYNSDYYSKNNVFLDVPKVVFGGTKIGDYACYLCSEVKEVEILDTVTYIGYDAFAFTKFESITVPSSVKSISKYAFYNAKLKNLELCNGVESIGYNAFYKCPLISLHIPASVKSITGECLSGKLEYITADENNPTYYSVNNCLIKRDTKELVAGTLNSIIPSDGSVTSIGKYAFYYSECETMVIPKGVTVIKEQAFFASKLKSIVISNTVTGVRSGAFDQCESLRTMYYHGTAEEAQSLVIHSMNNVYIGTAKRYYYSETEPTEEGNYWRYVDGVPTVW